MFICQNTYSISQFTPRSLTKFLYCTFRASPLIIFESNFCQICLSNMTKHTSVKMIFSSGSTHNFRFRFQGSKKVIKMIAEETYDRSKLSETLLDDPLSMFLNNFRTVTRYADSGHFEVISAKAHFIFTLIILFFDRCS